MNDKVIYDALRQPEYTGENRCIPCTIVNLAIAAAVAGGLALASPTLGVAAFAAFAGVVYLRGYLVPGTPTLTKRYFPEAVLRRFDKGPAVGPALGTGVNADEDLDPEAALVGVGALEPDAAGDDLHLTPEFAAAWREQVTRVRGGTTPHEELAGLLGVDADRVSLAGRGRSFTAEVDSERVGRWPSRAAFVGDLASDAVLQDRARDWEELPVERRSALVGSLRVFLEVCPVCDGPVTLDAETRQSCCRSREVIAGSCRDCRSRLFEIEAAEVGRSGGATAGA